MWFSKVPGYLFDKQRTPYLTEAKDLTLAQSQYELVAYGSFCRKFIWHCWSGRYINFF